MLTESLEDSFHILRCCISDCFQILPIDVRSSEPKHAVDDRVINGGMVNPHHVLPRSQQALVRSEFLREHIARNRLLVIDEHDIHCAVADIAEHIHTLEIGEPVSHGSKALREHIDAYYLNRVIGIAERELN